jgi:hypothetical protein
MRTWNKDWREEKEEDIIRTITEEKQRKETRKQKEKEIHRKRDKYS